MKKKFNRSLARVMGSTPLLGALTLFFKGKTVSAQLQIHNPGDPPPNPTEEYNPGFLNGSHHGNNPPPPSPPPKPPKPGDGGYVTIPPVTPPTPPPGSSTPFLTTWNGATYAFENDFLFGKPDTAFLSYESGHRAYAAGAVGHDTYIIQNELAEEDGKVKVQIREIEPEESFIDQFTLHTLDIPDGYVPFVDGDLQTLRVFDSTATQTLTHATHLYHKKENVFEDGGTFVQDSITESGARDVLLQQGDEILLTLQPDSVHTHEGDVYLRVASHFRDWTLADEVPFSALEQFQIKSAALTKGVSSVVLSSLLVAGLAGGAVVGTDTLKEAVKTPVVYADKSGKCLFVTAHIDGQQHTLQTLYPRFVQTSNEVVEIPRALITKMREMGTALTIRISATKRHMVSSAYLFTGTDASHDLTHELKLTSATHHQATTDTAVDARALTDKNGTYTHTLPADTIDLTYEVPEQETSQRFFVLKAYGFYTRLSDAYAWSHGNSWYTKLNAESRTLLKVFKKRSRV